MSSKTIYLNEIEERSEDIFEAAIIIGKRARQIIAERILKNEIHSFEKNSELSEDELNELKTEIGMNYVELTKATTIAIDEFCNDELEWKYEGKNLEK